MQKKRSKTVVSKHFVSSFKMSKDAADVEYVVEAKQGNRWTRVGGPFENYDDANDFASQYSAAHPGIQVQVVVFQS